MRVCLAAPKPTSAGAQKTRVSDEYIQARQSLDSVSLYDSKTLSQPPVDACIHLSIIYLLIIYLDAYIHIYIYTYA